MEDIFGNEIRVGDICALSARIGKHDTCIKLFYVISLHEEVGANGRGKAEFLRGYDGAGCLTQVQKAHNIVVINARLRPDHQRFRHIMDRLSEEERANLRRRLSP